MQPHYTGASDLVNVTIPFIDNDVCDTDANDDENPNKYDLLDEQGHFEANFNVIPCQKADNQSVIIGVSTKMTIPKTNDNLLNARRPLPFTLKPNGDTNLNKNATDNGIDKNQDSEVECKGINIKFRDIIYRQKRELSWDRSTKTILNGLNGEIRAGELTAIMGPSGSGKSTLLEILTGYTTKLANGTITIDGRSRNLTSFRSQTAYIMQNEVLQMHITVYEAMYFSVHLKIGSQLQLAEKKERIQEILEALGLYEYRHTKTGELSGGQRKRLAIALELVDNPQFMAFDEPTSGLDSSTSTQVVLLLKQLVQEGRTIVCTIHQPSALVFGLFDHLYAIAEGQCIYAGSTGMLVPFLAELNLICPKTYNPSDYLLEIATHDYDDETTQYNRRLVAKIQNGLNEAYRANTQTYNYSWEIAARMFERGVVTPVFAPDLAPLENSTSNDVTPLTRWKKPKTISLQLSNGECCAGQSRAYATSFYRQWYLLMCRTILCLRRDRSLALMRFIIHAFIAVLMGTLYYNIGNNAAMMFNNFRFIFLTLMFLMFTSFSTMTIIFPIEMPIVAREHFNRWYSKRAYYFALTFADLPLQFTCVFMYVLITYWMTGQPLESYRLGLFLLIAVMVTLVSQGLGMIVGAACGVKMGVVVGPFVIAPFVAFSGLFLRLADAPGWLHWLFHISYLKYAAEGATHAIFGFNRPKLECNDIYCHYRFPLKFMKLVDMHHNDYITTFIVLLVICILLRIIAFFIMALRLKRR